jgi:3-oxoadipate enol-lactonase
VLLAFDESGAGATVVLVHGHPFDRTMWSRQLRSLDGAFRLIAPDLRGYGESPATAGTLTMRELADHVWTCSTISRSATSQRSG